VLAVHDGAGGITGDAWDDTAVELPQPVAVQDALRPGVEPLVGTGLRLAELFAELPVALAVGRSSS
jgi:hypothetical protein